MEGLFRGDVFRVSDVEMRLTDDRRDGNAGGQAYRRTGDKTKVVGALMYVQRRIPRQHIGFDVSLRSGATTSTCSEQRFTFACVFVPARFDMNLSRRFESSWSLMRGHPVWTRSVGSLLDSWCVRHVTVRPGPDGNVRNPHLEIKKMPEMIRGRSGYSTIESYAPVRRRGPFLGRSA